MLEALTRQLAGLQPLSADQVARAVACLIDAQVPAGVKADFLAALARKGETIAEIAAFVRELRAKAIQPTLDPETRSRLIVDVCGTGGDRLNTFNISTTVALILAAGGVTVAKHGNRAITSQAGSADVLEALGVAIDLAPDQAAGWLRDHGFAFFFAPRYHPAFQHLGPARKLCAERGQRTVFNFLGPLLNPARPAAQLVGVSQPELCEPLACVLRSLGVRRAMVVSGRAGKAWLDELSTLGDTTVASVELNGVVNLSVIAPDRFPLQRSGLTDLAGGDPGTNAQIVRRLLGGQEQGPKRDTVLLNAGAAFVVAGKAGSVAEGWDLAARVIDEGTGEAKLAELRAAS